MSSDPAAATRATSATASALCGAVRRDLTQDSTTWSWERDDAAVDAQAHQQGNSDSGRSAESSTKLVAATPIWSSQAQQIAAVVNLEIEYGTLVSMIAQFDSVLFFGDRLLNFFVDAYGWLVFSSRHSDIRAASSLFKPDSQASVPLKVSLRAVDACLMASLVVEGVYELADVSSKHRCPAIMPGVKAYAMANGSSEGVTTDDMVAYPVDGTNLLNVWARPLGNRSKLYFCRDLRCYEAKSAVDCMDANGVDVCCGAHRTSKHVASGMCPTGYNQLNSTEFEHFGLSMTSALTNKEPLSLTDHDLDKLRHEMNSNCKIGGEDVVMLAFIWGVPLIVFGAATLLRSHHKAKKRKRLKQLVAIEEAEIGRSLSTRVSLSKLGAKGVKGVKGASSLLRELTTMHRSTLSPEGVADRLHLPLEKIRSMKLAFSKHAHEIQDVASSLTKGEPV